MGNKINAHGLRLGVNKTWDSIWFADGQQYQKQLHQDLKIRDKVRKALALAGLDSVIIKRSENALLIDVFVSKPGVAIGRGGTGLDILKVELLKLTKANIEIKINEVKKPDLSAKIIARTIADGVEKRLPMKALMENSKQKAMFAGANGIKIVVGGRIGGASQARNVKTLAGQVPLQTIKANIDYAEERAMTKDLGIFGIKVWVYKPNEL